MRCCIGLPASDQQRSTRCSSGRWHHLSLLDDHRCFDRHSIHTSAHCSTVHAPCAPQIYGLAFRKSQEAVDEDEDMGDSSQAALASISPIPVLRLAPSQSADSCTRGNRPTLSRFHS
ncbi:hypothetical protein PMAYCL1PPCAC_16557 [Pristionchus mayeri]|uniref:Uncharacterized protein n=1 Tax=Pristionchus mayeri TaxID=1317129 RepID=A0AAN5HZD2_9BILA|nr:hypothetical protein PMAYCL1PPCAC_16557 [Pristionchus mayeri]